MKRMQGFLVASIAGVVLFASPNAWAESYYNDGTYEWRWERNANGNGAILTGWYDEYSGTEVCGVSPRPTGKVTVPAFVTSPAWDDKGNEYEARLPVTELCHYLFKGCDTMTEVVLPETVQLLNWYPFDGCSALETINVPRALTACRVGNPFRDTAWWTKQAGEFVTFGPVLLAYQQRGTNNVVKIPDGITMIAESAFAGEETFDSVDIPASVKEIGHCAFEDCSNLRTVTGAANVEVCGYRTFAGTPFCETSGSNSLVQAGSAVVGYTGTLPEELVIPEGVLCIADEAFYGCGDFQTVSFPASLRRIGDYAFSGCFKEASADMPPGADELGFVGLTTVTIPETLQSIGNYAFSGCYCLTDVTIEDSPAIAGLKWVYELFDESPIRNLTFNLPFVTPNFLGLGKETLESLTFGNQVVLIGDDDDEVECYDGMSTAIFNGYNALTTITFGTSLEMIRPYAFSDCAAIKSITIPAGVTAIDEYAFSGCGSLSEVDFGGGMDAIDMNPFTVFKGTPWLENYLASFPVPENDSFANAFLLEEIPMRAVGTNINATAEEDDPLETEFGSETSVWWKWTAEVDGDLIFDTFGSTFDTVMGVYTLGPSNTLATVATNDDGERGYEEAEEENRGGSSVTFWASAGTTYYIAIGGYESAIGTIVLNGYQYQLDIEDGVLYGYRGSLPDELVIPEGVTEIAEEAFFESALVSVTLPASLEYIGDYAFSYSQLEKVNGLTDEIERGLLPFVGTLFSSTLPFRLVTDGNVLIGFEGTCPSVVEIPEGIAAIEESAFDCDVTGYYIANPNYAPPADVDPANGDDCIETNAVDCVAAYNIDEEEEDRILIPTVSNLTEVRIPASVTRIDKYAFWGCENLATVSVANPDVNIEWTAFNQCLNLATLAIGKRGYSQTGWLLVFDAPAYLLPLDGGDLNFENPLYAAGTVLTFPSSDLSILRSRIIVTNENGVVGKLISQEVREIQVQGDCDEDEVSWVSVPVWINAVWERNTPEIFEDEASDDDAFEGNTQYTGWLRDANDNLVGTITVKASKPNAKTKVSKLTATVVMLADGKKSTFTGTAVAGGNTPVNLTGKGGPLVLTTLSDDAMNGHLGNYTIEAAKNVFSSKASDDKASAGSVPKKTWTATFVSTKGYTTFTIAVAAKGKTKITGVLPDGTKVSVSAQAVVGDGGRWCVPVMFSKKSKFGFVAWFEKGANGKTTFSDISDLTPLRGPKGSFTEWEAVLDACGPVGSLASEGHTVLLFTDPAIPGLLSGLLPDGEKVTVKKSKWTMAKAAKVTYKKGALTVTPGTKGGTVQNAANMKLSFTAKTGTFKGGFTAYSVKGGKLVKTKFTVNGAVVNRTAYGTAFNKTAGSILLMIQ
ncbi:MAG: leucine-rich repeat protein [Kiritimatiellae bacterium]|nr:leucine-rich repeat protein [Kiritimatiellia bacterium]